MNKDSQTSREFKGIWIPREIWLSKELSIGEKVMLAEIDSLEGEKGCYCSNKYLAEFFGLSPDRVSDIISKLVKKGFVKTNYVSGKPLPEQRLLQIAKRDIWGIGENKGGDRRKRLGGIGENAEHITKYITKNITNTHGGAFSLFWEEYPPTRKQDKAKCISVWSKLSAAECTVVLADVKRRKVEHYDWVKENGRYVPAPLVYLRNRRWETSIIPIPADKDEGAPQSLIIRNGKVIKNG